MKILALDFDGVLADSQLECLFSGFNTYLKYFPKSSLFGSKFSFENFDEKIKKYKKEIEEYKRLRPFIRFAADFCFIFEIMEQGLKVKTQKEFDKARENMSCPSEYAKEYYVTRGNIQNENMGEWIRIETPYEKIVEDTKKLGEKFKLTISTGNSIASIREWLKRKELNIPDKDTVDKNFAKDKIKQLTKIKEDNNVNFEDIYFIDDQVDHLIKVKPLGVKCFLATWGYNNKEQQEQAKKAGIILINKDNYYDMLMRM